MLKDGVSLLGSGTNISYSFRKIENRFNSCKKELVRISEEIRTFLILELFLNYLNYLSSKALFHSIQIYL